MTHTATLQIANGPVRPAAGLLRSTLAWLGGCIAAAMTVYWALGVSHLAGGVGEPGLFIEGLIARLPQAAGMIGLIAFLTIVPLPLTIILIRETRLPRGTSDMFFCALLGGLLAQIFGLPVLEGGEGIARTILAALTGAMGGLTYWIMAGRPD